MGRWVTKAITGTMLERAYMSCTLDGMAVNNTDVLPTGAFGSRGRVGLLACQGPGQH